MTICKPGGALLPDVGHDSILILDFIASRTMRNKCVLFKPYILWYFVLVACADYDTFYCPLVILYFKELTTARSPFQFHLPVISGYFSIFLGELRFWCHVFYLYYIKGLSVFLRFLTILCVTSYPKTRWLKTTIYLFQD